MNLMPDLPRALDRRSKSIKLPVWSFTWLNCYRNICPHQAFRRFLLRDIPFSETDAMKEGTAVHKALEERVGPSARPLPDRYRQHEPFAAAFAARHPRVEWKLGITEDGTTCDFFAPAVFGRGKLDLAIVEPATHTAYIGDYKTGKVREDPFELEIQALLLQARFPDLQRIVGQYIWLREGRLGQLYDLSGTERTWATVCDTIESVERALRQGAGGFDKNPGALCKQYCDVMDCEHNGRR